MAWWHMVVHAGCVHIMLSVLIWSAMTSYCGFQHGYWFLGVALGYMIAIPVNFAALHIDQRIFGTDRWG
jgi:hypothetical protein